MRISDHQEFKYPKWILSITVEEVSDSVVYDYILVSTSQSAVHERRTRLLVKARTSVHVELQCVRYLI